MQKNIIITMANGLHARPATELATIAKNFESRIILRTEQREADIRSVIAMLALGLRKDSKVILDIEGKDSREAMEAVEQFLK